MENGTFPYHLTLKEDIKFAADLNQIDPEKVSCFSSFDDLNLEWFLGTVDVSLSLYLMGHFSHFLLFTGTWSRCLLRCQPISSMDKEPRQHKSRKFFHFTAGR